MSIVGASRFSRIGIGDSLGALLLATVHLCVRAALTLPSPAAGEGFALPSPAVGEGFHAYPSRALAWKRAWRDRLAGETGAGTGWTLSCSH